MFAISLALLGAFAPAPFSSPMVLSAPVTAAAPAPALLPFRATSGGPSRGPSRGPDVEEIAAKLALDQPVADRIAAAQELAGLGKKSAPALSQMILGLNDPEPQVIDALAVALQAIGKNARVPLLEVLGTGEFEGQKVSLSPVTRVLLGMGKASAKSVRVHIDGMEMGPDKLAFVSGLGVEGLPYLAEALGTDDGAHDLGMMRMLRQAAATAERDPESVQPALKKIKDTARKLAFETVWSQNPQTEFLPQYGAWVAGDDPMLVDTGLWAIGLLGKDAVGQAAGVIQHIDSEDPLTRATALWALASLVEPGPGPVIAEIPASFPGASKAATEQMAKATEDEVFKLWRDTGKALGYRGRIGSKAREIWGFAPTWTSTTLPVPEAPDRSKMPAEVLAAEDRLFALASGGTGLDARLASDALAAFGNVEERSRDLWLKWLLTDNVPLIQSALIGLRPIGRGIIMIDPELQYEHERMNEGLVAMHLNRPETMVAASQLLTSIKTPTAWAAVVNQISILEGKPPLGMVLAISRYDAEALRPYLPQMQDLYEKGNYMFSAFLIKFGAEALSSFEKELTSKLTDRRMVAVESLGHIGKDARSLLPKLKAIKDTNLIVQKMVKDAIKRIQ